MRDYLWEGNSKGPLKHLVNWKITSKNLEDGGLGIGGLTRRNNALLAKWGWRFGSEPHSLWRKVVESIHDSDSLGWFTYPISSICKRSPWSNISKQWRLVDSFVCFKLGCGSQILFWHSLWIANNPLKVRFHNLFKLSPLPLGKVSKFWDHNTHSWQVGLRR